jgi:alkylated DNA nucleotide flippase Atl1
MRSASVDDPGVERMLRVVEAVPAGRVITYGDLSELAGYGGPRTAGAVMARHGAGVPWHRVVSAQGTVPGHLVERAQALWRAEGTPLREGSAPRVDLRAARWSPSVEELSRLDDLAQLDHPTPGPDVGARRQDGSVADPDPEPAP